MSSPFARALNKVLAEGRFTAHEIADWGDCSDRHIYNVADLTHSADLSAGPAGQVARRLGDHGELRPAYAFVPSGAKILRPTYLGTADGCVKAEVIKLLHAASGADDAYDDLDTDALRRAVQQGREALADLEAELARLEGRK